MNSKEFDKQKLDASFKGIVIPLLRSHGWTDQQINSMMPRVGFIRDHRNWSIRLENTDINDVPEIEKVLRHEPNSNRLILQAFINKGKVLSYGVIPASILSVVIKNSNLCTDQISKVEKKHFRCFSFAMAKHMFGNSCYVFNA